MGDICYVSRGLGGHDRHWIQTLRGAGHHVRTITVSDPEHTAQQIRASAAGRAIDLVVAGPLTDATLAAVRADVAPVLAISWAFDLLAETGSDAGLHNVVEALRGAAGVHVDCRHLAQVAIKLGANADTISVAAWGVDTDLFSPGEPAMDLRASVGWRLDHRVVLTTRTWASIYGVDTALQGFADAVSRDSGLRLAWVGNGPDESILRKLVRSLELQEFVAELGVLKPTSLRDWIRTSDVYVSAATCDGSSLSLLESLAVGRPAVVADLPSNREWIIDNDFGRLFATGSVAELGSAISTVVATDSTESQRKRRRELVLAKGHWPHNRKTFLAAVERLM